MRNVWLQKLARREGKSFSMYRWNPMVIPDPIRGKGFFFER
jgi:hypothetical protein